MVGRFASVTQRVVIILSFAVAMFPTPLATAAPTVDPGAFPLSQLRPLAQQFAPGVAIPTTFPPLVKQFRQGTGRLEGYAQRAAVDLRFEKGGENLYGFRLDVFNGSHVTQISRAVQAYLKTGGWKVTTAPFRAGRYRGLLNRETNGANSYEMYTCGRMPDQHMRSQRTFCTAEKCRTPGRRKW